MLDVFLPLMGGFARKWSAFAFAIGLFFGLASGTMDDASHGGVLSKWIDASTLPVWGKGFNDTASPFTRLPRSARGVVPSTVWDLSEMSAGLKLSFRTNSSAISVDVEVTGSLAYPHMSATGKSGLSLFSLDESGRWRFAGSSAVWFGPQFQNDTYFSFWAERCGASVPALSANLQRCA